MRKVTLIILSLVISINNLKSQQVNAIDSAYCSEMDQFAKNAIRLTGEAWPDMRISPFCIFRLNGTAFITNHPDFDGVNTKIDSIYTFNAQEFGLMGATQTEIKGKLVAHNDYGHKHYPSVNSFYSELYHEIHHVYQRQYIKNLIYDNPAEMLTYPENPDNDAIKLYENEILLNLIKGTPNDLKENINLFYTCRNARKTIIGDKYSNYEKAVESIEGPATFCEYMYMNKFANTATDSAYIQNRFFYSLIEPNYGRGALRSKYLLTGMAQCLLLTKYFPEWQKEYYASGLYLNDFFFSKFKPQPTDLPELNYYISKAKYFTIITIQKHQKELNEFNSQNGTRITLHFKSAPNFRGFDPMHAEAITDSVILHTTLLKLSKGSNSLNFYNHKVLSLINDQVWFVKTATFYIDEQDIKMENNRLRVKTENIEIDWEYNNKTKDGSSVSFFL